MGLADLFITSSPPQVGQVCGEAALARHPLHLPVHGPLLPRVAPLQGAVRHRPAVDTLHLTVQEQQGLEEPSLFKEHKVTENIATIN